MEDLKTKCFNDFCKTKNCPEYIEWTFGMGANCVSCKLVGQSYNIEEYPSNCIFLDEIVDYETQLRDHLTEALNKLK